MFSQNIAALAHKLAGLSKQNVDLRKAINVARNLPAPEKGSKEFHRGWDSALKAVDKAFSDLGH